MRIGCIAEYGARGGQVGQVLADVHESRQRFQRSDVHQMRSAYALALGATDLLEISIFRTFFPLAELGGSPSQAFRRAVGVLAPTRQQLRRWDLRLRPPGTRTPGAAICDAMEIIQGDPNGQNAPFLAVIALKLAPLVRLVLPPTASPEDSLGAQAIRALFQSQSKVWDSIDSRVDQAEYRRSAPGPQPPRNPICLSPLLGLDGLEPVVVCRCSRMEDLSAVVWSLRRATASLAFRCTPEIEARATPLVGLSADEVRAAWGTTPLFDASNTTLGVPLEQHPPAAAAERHIVHQPAQGDGPVWCMPAVPRPSEAAPEQEPVAVDHASFFIHVLHRPEHKALGRKIANELRGEKIDPDDPLYYFFGPLQSMVFDTQRGAEAHPDRRSRRFTVAELFKLLAANFQLDRPIAERGDVRTATHPAVLPILGKEAPPLWPDPDLLLTKALRRRLRDERVRHLSRSAEGSWTRRWLQGAQRAAIPYPLTNGVLNLLAGLMDSLADDPLGSTELLEAMGYIMDCLPDPPTAEERAVRPDGLLDADLHALGPAADMPESDQMLSPNALGIIFRRMEHIALRQARSDSPLRHPRSTLSFSAHAGMTLMRDAFSAYSRDIADHLDLRDGQLFVIDDAAGQLSTRPGPGACTSVIVAALALQVPLHWAMQGHEMAHGAFHHLRFAYVRQQEVQRNDGLTPLTDAWEDLLLSVGRRGCGPNQRMHNTLDTVAGHVSHSLGRTGEGFERALADIIDDTLADLVARSCLQAHPREDRDTVNSRFWFIAGPGLVMANSDQLGRAHPPFQRVQSLVLRLFFLSRITEDPAWGANWRADLESTLVSCHNMHGDFEHDRRHRVMDLGGCPPAQHPLLRRLRCLKEDIGIDDNAWYWAIDDLRTDWALEADEKPGRRRNLHNTVHAWVRLAQEVQGGWVQAPQDEAATTPRRRYIAYVDQLQNQFSALAGCPLPWLSFVQGSLRSDAALHNRRASGGEVPVFARRGGLIRLPEGQDWSREYMRLTLDLLHHLSEARRDWRGRRLLDYLQPTDAPASTPPTESR